MSTMPLTTFRAIPLIRRFFSLDDTTGDLIRHEVRRDPISGLTLTAKFPLGDQHHD